MVQQVEVGHVNGTKVLRGGPPFVDFNILLAWAKNDPIKITWVNWLQNIFQPLQGAQEMDLSDWVSLHMRTVQELSDSPAISESRHVWEKDAGIAALEALKQIQEQAHFGGFMTAAEYNALLRSTLSQELRLKRQTAVSYTHLRAHET